MKTNRCLAAFVALGGLACTLLLAACGGSASSANSAAKTDSTTGAAATTAPTTANADFTSPDGVYALKYPTAWSPSPITAENTTGAMMFISADGKDMFITGPLDTQIDSANYGTLAKAFLTGAKATDISMGSTTSSATFTSGTWQGIQGTATFNGVASTITELGQDHNGKTFMIFTIAPTVSSSSDGNTYFQPIMDSLSFLN
ncbi:MAG: hypothetical protein H0X24_13060 [Ktedonobacterales bacterium]|nr:hypothetical protein [Ktedonobacterales bacterium]